MPANEAHEQPVLTILITSEPANRFTLSLFGRVNVLKDIEFNSSKDNNNKNYWFLDTKVYTNIFQSMSKLVRAALYQTV
jgi:hypothetical protein